MNISPADFNADGRLDILVTMWDEGKGGWWSPGGGLHAELQVVLGSEEGLGTSRPIVTANNRPWRTILGSRAISITATDLV